jgi:hypothetical protein
MSSTREILDALRLALSNSRISTYEGSAHVANQDDPSAIALYAWNAKISAALFVPLHFCEVVVRNAASQALELLYGPRWPWDLTLLLSLPDPRRAYSPRKDLRNVASVQPTTGKVIPELKFVFWQEIFALRHGVRIWDLHYKSVFPFHDPTKTAIDLRRKMFQDLNQIRHLRNRIAHHEPIFSRRLIEELNLMIDIVGQRSPLVASWMISNQDAFEVLSQRPLFRGGKRWTPTHDEVARVAYRLWEDGGGKVGSADANWAEAERLLGIL